MPRVKYVMIWCFLTTCGFAGAQTAPTDVLSLSASAKPRQSFAGFGTSLTNFDGRFQQLPPDVREQLVASVFRDLNFKILRLWCEPADFHKTGALGAFKTRYIDSGLIDLARKYGCTTLLLAPSNVPDAFATPKAAEKDSFTYFADESVPAYAKLLAEFIAKLRDAGVTLQAAGVLNEPNDRPIRFSHEQWPVVIKALRSELDVRGLKAVAIIAPEAASADSWAQKVQDALRKDPTAWAALGGFATHTYNMGATPAMIRRLGEMPYWQTESSTPGPEPDTAAEHVNAATTAARVLGDLNHGVTHWVWFIGFEQSDNKDNGTRLIRYDATKPHGAVHRFAKHAVLRQLSAAFPPGTQIHPVQHPTEKGMPFTYGRKPAILAVAGRQADGTWSAAVVNYTSDRFAELPKYARAQAGPDEGRQIELTLHLPGAGNGAFTVRRSNGRQFNTDAGRIEATDGLLRLKLAPLELVTLVQAP
jgi:O-glycosyl hydrolase